MQEDNDGLWLPLSELARAKGVSRQSIFERLRRLESQGHALSRPGPGRTVLVHVARFDHAVGETTDAVRALNGTRDQRSGSSPSVGSLAREQARRAAYDADLKELELGLRRGTLVEVERVRDAFAVCGETLVRGLENMAGRADEAAAAIARDGAAGSLRFLESIAAELIETAKQAFGKCDHQLTGGA